jgi:thiol:disulfide interchange protein DsbA
MASSLAACGQKASISEPTAATQPAPTPAEPVSPGTAEPAASQSDVAPEPSMVSVSNPAAAGAASAQLREGVNYQKLTPPQPTNVGPGETEVVEVFWYGCGHCYVLDPAVEAWRKQGKPSYVKFVRVPAMWNDTLKIHARAFYTAEALGKLEELHSQIFSEIHKKNNPLNTPDLIQAFFVARGVTADEFKRTFTSFSVETKLQRAEQLNRRYRVQSVPVMVIDGKYTTDLSTAGSEQNLFKIIAELAARERGNA